MAMNMLELEQDVGSLPWGGAEHLHKPINIKNCRVFFYLVQGIAALMAMSMLELEKDVGGLPWGGAEHLHKSVAAMRSAFADALAYNADPDVVPVPVERLLSKEYAVERHKAAAADHVRVLYVSVATSDRRLPILCSERKVQRWQTI